MRLGELLVREGRLTPSQLEAVVKHQTRVGGRLGTAIVEMRFLDVDTITVYLGLVLGIPIATNAALARAKRSAVRLLRPEMAARLMCVPLVIQGRQLIVAMEDPHDLVALDELAAHTGYRIIPRVAAEVRLTYYIERYFGVPRVPRHLAMADLVLGVHSRAGDARELPPPPLPGLPPVTETVATPPRPPHLRAVPSDRAEDAQARGSAPLASTRTDELAAELASDGGETADAVPPSQAPVGAPPPAAKTQAGAALSVAPLSADAAIAKIRDATTRAQVADALIGFAAAEFDVAVLFVVKSEMAFGWRGFAPDMDDERIEALLVPLAPASIFRTCIATNDVFVGAVPPNALHAHLFRVLRVSPPVEAVIVPVYIRDRLVNMLYGQNNGEDRASEEGIAQLRQVGAAASDAYVRLIGLQKKRA